MKVRIVYKAHQCKVCKDTFHSSRADAQFCSSACRQRNYRNKVAELSP